MSKEAKAKAKSPSKFFATILKSARLAASFVGADVVDPDFRINWVTIVVIVCITIYFIFTVTTVIDKFAENWTYFLEASCMLGSVLQGIAKLFFGIKFRKKLIHICNILTQMYAEYETKGAEYVLVLRRGCVQLWNTMRFVGIIYMASSMGIIVLTIAMVMVTGNRYLIMHFIIPGVDVKTDVGYLLTMGVHSVVIMAGGMGLFAGDLFFLILLMQGNVIVDIFKLKVAELNELSERVKADKRTKVMLNDIIIWHQFYTDFNEKCNDVFYYVISVQITTSGFSILCSMYIILLGEWPGVYFYVVCAFCGLYLYCVMGTKIENCNDEICDEIYNIYWYNLLRAEAKMVMTALMKSQNPSNIKVGGVLPLSVETGLSITKTLYGIFTMMLQMLGEE